MANQHKTKAVRALRVALQALVVLMPWFIRRKVLERFWGYSFAPGSSIGTLCWAYPERLVMGAGARIHPLNVIIHLSLLDMGAHSSIGRGNWITGHAQFSTNHFVHRLSRTPSLLLGTHSAITKSHVIDCTDLIEIGAYTTVAGYGSQLITHGIDIVTSRQDCRPIKIGNYCLVGTRSTILGGAALPDKSVLAAGSVLVQGYTEPHTLYAGVPARPVKVLSADSAYFSRTVGYID